MFRLVIFTLLIAGAWSEIPLVRPKVTHLEGKIVGGESATIEQFPYQLSFEYYGRQFCGASLFRTNIAVTAAHCTDEVRGPSMNSLIIRAGSSVTGVGGQTAGVRRICQHPKYTSSGYDYDVAVLILDRSLTLTASVQIIPLQPSGLEVPAGSLGYVTGWGTLQHNGALPDSLRAAQVPRVTDEECRRNYLQENISSRMICFGYQAGGKDACQGDSGGPLMVNGKLVGIVSWGYACAAPNFPGVYTKVSNSEIQEYINTCPM